jgi:hypothetical protein
VQVIRHNFSTLIYIFQCDGGKCVAHQFCSNSSLNNGEGLLDIRNNFEETCFEYTKTCCPHDNILEHPILPGAGHVVTEGCGYRNGDGVGYRISGATSGESEYGEFPWMVAVTEQKEVFGTIVSVYACGGSLIHASVILTGKLIRLNK